MAPAGARNCELRGDDVSRIAILLLPSLVLLLIVFIFVLFVLFLRRISTHVILIMNILTVILTNSPITKTITPAIRI